MKYFLLLSALSCLSVEAFAKKPAQPKASLNNFVDTNARGTQGINLADASANLKNSGFYISADVLYYNLYQDLSFANSLTISPLPQVAGSYKQYNLNPKFSGGFGFKTGLGYYSGHDDFQTGAVFTYYNSKATKTARAGANEYITQGGGGGGDRAYLYDHRVMNFQYYDLEWTLSRDFFVSKKLAINPAIGAKGTWFYQNQNDDLIRKDTRGNTPWATNKSENQKVENRSWLVGPLGSVSAKFYFDNHWNLFGKGSGAVLWGYSNQTSNSTNYNANNSELTSFYYNLSSTNSVHHLVGYMSFSLNLGYDTNYDSDRFNLSTSVGYTGSYYFVQAQFPYIMNELSGFNLNFTFSF